MPESASNVEDLTNDNGNTVILNSNDERNESGELVLRLRSVVCSELSTSSMPTSEQRRTVTFTPDTVDNEHLGRLKSNCCCIYLAPRVWDDRSTWDHDENETEHCRGHTISVTHAKSSFSDGQSKTVSQNTNDVFGNPLTACELNLLSHISGQKSKVFHKGTMLGEPLFDEDDFKKAWIREKKR